MRFFVTGFFADYTPGYLYALWLVGIVGNAIGGVGDLIKLPAIITDVVLAYVASNISLPFIAPFITFAEIVVGARILHGAWPTLSPEQTKQLALGTVAHELVLGTLVVGATGALAGAALAYGLTALVRRRRAA